MLHDESSRYGIGILNMECAVDPFRRSWDAIPEDATQSSFLPTMPSLKPTKTPPRISSYSSSMAQVGLGKHFFITPLLPGLDLMAILCSVLHPLGLHPNFS